MPSSAPRPESDLERFFKGKTFSMVLSVMLSVTAALLISYFELQRAAARPSDDIARLQLQIAKLKDSIDTQQTATNSIPEVAKAVKDIQSQLDVVRRDMTASQSKTEVLDKKLDEIRILLKK